MDERSQKKKKRESQRERVGRGKQKKKWRNEKREETNRRDVTPQNPGVR